MPNLVPKTLKEDLSRRTWRIDPMDEKTHTKLLELLQEAVRGPITTVPFCHAIYKYKERRVYKAPYFVVKFFIDNREAKGYDFLSFSKISINQPFQLHKEGKGLHDSDLQKMFRHDTFIAKGVRCG